MIEKNSRTVNEVTQWQQQYDDMGSNPLVTSVFVVAFPTSSCIFYGPLWTYPLWQHVEEMGKGMPILGGASIAGDVTVARYPILPPHPSTRMKTRWPRPSLRISCWLRKLTSRALNESISSLPWKTKTIPRDMIPIDIHGELQCKKLVASLTNVNNSSDVVSRVSQSICLFACQPSVCWNF